MADYDDDPLGKRDAGTSCRGAFLRHRVANLACLLKKNGLTPPSLLGEAVRLVAKIGGYLGRNNDPPPGHQLLWQGYTEFQFMCIGFALLEEK